MNKILISVILVGCLLLTACNSESIGIIGGADGPTSIIVSEKKDNNGYDVKKYFDANYVNILSLPMLDIHIENPFVSDDRVLILEDTIENNLELMLYEYYRNRMSGAYKEVKDVIADKNLLIATENEEKSFKDGVYYSKIILDEIDVLSKDDVDEISYKNKQDIVEMLSNFNTTEFAIVKVEKTIKHNDKALSMAPQVGDGEVTRYYLLAKIDGVYNIAQVYWEGFIDD